MTLSESLSRYREYHRDGRNVLTHAIGIPMIVLSITTLLARPMFDVGGVILTPALIAAVLAAIFYVRLELWTGVLMAMLLTLFTALGQMIANSSDALWLGGGIGLFVVGWIFQLVGHKFEGRKPAFVDDLRSFLVGPLFVVVEGLFALGLMQDLRREMED
ncbi:DUF962 domain-containing protein [Aurantiacibacter sp. MUD11]|uniref:Mpo1 family 2-hydroxy fatty acid dioxygenase n=1 Tax=Aurantiacibacter sp. MUD11 TaxID=3003265 RepID=UPI0022AA616B|nr:Mpo1-like protein [Aurantiacibacter sp. MUD11]WAT18084.1 DUF962 domain-containing protein [Aurantiacibacter sp. MUD11]